MRTHQTKKICSLKFSVVCYDKYGRKIEEIEIKKVDSELLAQFEFGLLSADKKIQIFDRKVLEFLIGKKG